MTGLKPASASTRSRSSLCGLGLAGAGLEPPWPRDAELGLGLVQAGGGGVVERLVAAAADVVGQADLEVAWPARTSVPAAGAGVVVVAAAGGQDEGAGE